MSALISVTRTEQLSFSWPQKASSWTTPVQLITHTLRAHCTTQRPLKALLTVHRSYQETSYKGWFPGLRGKGGCQPKGTHSRHSWEGSERSAVWVQTAINKALCLLIMKKADLQCSCHRNDKHLLYEILISSSQSFQNIQHQCIKTKTSNIMLQTINKDSFPIRINKGKSERKQRRFGNC